MKVGKQSSKKNVLTIAVNALVGLTAATWLPHASAQPVLEEVIVTAQKRAESLQDVPISVQAMAGEKLHEAGIQKLEDLSAYIPNFTMTESAVGNTVFIRGIGSGINQGFEQSVGMFIDGIYAGRSHQFRAPFLDLERVEVLKGPQGTLFGKNTIAGAVNITSAKPTDEFMGYITALYEPDHGEQEGTVVLSGPISDNLSGRLAVRYREFDGYLENTISGEDEAAREESTVRGTLRWFPTDTVEVLLKAETGSFDVEGRAIQISDTDGDFITSTGTDFGNLDPLINDVENGRVDDKKTAATFPGLTDGNDTDTDLASLTVNWDIGEFTLTSITGYSAYEFAEDNDVDFSSLTLLHQIEDQDFDQLSQELRLVSPVGETLEYIVGVFWQDQELENVRYLDSDLPAAGAPIPPSTNYRTFDQDSTTSAVFAQGTWNATDVMRFTLGLRWSREEKDARQEVVVSDFQDRSGTSNPALEPFAKLVTGTIPHTYDESRSSTNVSPSFNVQYDLDGDTMLYARVAKGFKSGGFNEAEVTGDLDLFEFDDEEALSYEVGVKMGLLDGAATLNGNIFYTEYEDRQVSAFKGTSFVVGNAAESTTQGVEIDGQWAATEKLTLGLSVAYLDSTFDDFADAGCTADQEVAARTGGLGDCTQDLSGKTTEFAPEWTASFNASYYQPIGDDLELVVQVDGNYSDEYFYAQDLDSSESQDSYVKWNARLALASMNDTWEVALIGKNLTDETVTAHGNDIPLYLGAHYVFTERPRSVAIQATWRF